MGEYDFSMPSEVADLLLGDDTGAESIRQKVADRYLTRESDNAIEEAKQRLEARYKKPPEIPGGHLERHVSPQRIITPPKISGK